jgi:quinol monooxygenase YgiN
VTRELFVLLVRIPVKAGFENEYLSLINAVIDEMRHETSFVNAVVHQSTEDPTVFLLHETWLGRDEFFTVQMKRSYRESYEARLPQIMRAPRNHDPGAFTSGVCVPRHRALAGGGKLSNREKP